MLFPPPSADGFVPERAVKELRQQVGVEPVAVAIHGNDLAIFAIQPNASGPQEPASRPLDDRARRDVTVVVNVPYADKTRIVGAKRRRSHAPRRPVLDSGTDLIDLVGCRTLINLGLNGHVELAVLGVD